MLSNLYNAWVYILKCSDNSFYTGKSQSLEARIEQHQQGVYKKTFTYSRRPIKLVWSHGFVTYKDAIMCERQIKGWSKAKKEALICGDLDLLHELASCRNKSHFSNRNMWCEDWCFVFAQHEEHHLLINELCIILSEDVGLKLKKRMIYDNFC